MRDLHVHHSIKIRKELSQDKSNPGQDRVHVHVPKYSSTLKAYSASTSSRRIFTQNLLEICAQVLFVKDTQVCTCQCTLGLYLAAEMCNLGPVT